MAGSPKDPGSVDPNEGESPAPKPRRRAPRSTRDSGGAAAPSPTPKPRRRSTRTTTSKAKPTVEGAAADAAAESEPAAPTPVVAGPPEPQAAAPEAPQPSHAETPAADPTERRWPVRAIAAWVLTVLAGTAVTAGVIGFWVHQTVLETDRFMAAVTPAVESEAVQTVVADRLADEVIESLDLETRIAREVARASEGMTDALAEALGLTEDQVARLQRLDFGLQALAAPIASGVETRIRDAVDRFVSSVAGSDVLLRLVEVAHEKTVHLLRDELEELPNVVIDEGEVRLNLVPMVAEAIRAVVNAGIGVIGIDREIPAFSSSDDAEQSIQRLASLLGRDLDPDFGQVPLMTQDQLEDAQGLIRMFDRLVWVLIVLAIVLAVLAVVLAPTPTSGLVRIGIAVAVGIVIGWVGVGLISSRLADVAGTAEGRVAIAEVTDAVVSTLQPVVAALVIIGIGTTAAALAAGRGWWPTTRGVDSGA